MRHHTVMPPAARSHAVVLGLLVATVVLGLASRGYPQAFPRIVATYAGDVLWTTAAYWCLALARAAWPPARLAVLALGGSVLVELSQLVHAPWLDAIRGNPFGALVLGQGFLWSDLACYVVGAGLAALVDRVVMGVGRHG